MDQIARSNADRYASGAVTDEYLLLPHHQRRIALLVGLLRELESKDLPKRLLDVGAAPSFVRDIAQMNYQITAASLTATQQEWPTGVEPLDIDLSEGIPREDGTFDVVVAGDIIEHVFDPLALLLEARRVLSVGGVVIVTTPNLAGPQDRLSFLLGRSPRHVDPLHEYLRLHIRPFTLSKLCQVVRAAGFAKWRVHPMDAEIVLRTKRFPIPWLGQIVPSLGGSLIVSATKEAA